MSSFTQPLEVRELSKNSWETLRQFEFYIGDKKDNNVIIVPEGTITDFASIPQWLWSVFPPIGKYTQAAVLHDFLCVENKRGWKQSADIFLEAMKVLGVSEWRRNTMYFFVLLHGIGKKRMKFGEVFINEKNSASS